VGSLWVVVSVAAHTEIARTKSGRRLEVHGSRPILEVLRLCHGDECCCSGEDPATTIKRCRKNEVQCGRTDGFRLGFR
jgi:hypothetical protein